MLDAAEAEDLGVSKCGEIRLGSEANELIQSLAAIQDIEKIYFE
jgi:hypothetical protein